MATSRDLDLPRNASDGAPSARADDGTLGATWGDSISSLLRLQLDPTLLATFSSPSFSESSAIPLDALALSQSQSSPTMKHEPKRFKAESPVIKHEPPRFETDAHGIKREPTYIKTEAGESAVGKPFLELRDADATFNWLLSMRAPIDATQCKYRKGKCDQPRTRKKNGNLHSYCEFHRQRSIVNQRRFDSKRRAQRVRCECATACHAPHSEQLTTSGQSFRRPVDDVVRCSKHPPTTDHLTHSNLALHVIESDDSVWI